MATRRGNTETASPSQPRSRGRFYLAEGARREAKWREAGYHIISMKNDFKTFYGDGVVKTDFIFPTDTRTLTE